MSYENKHHATPAVEPGVLRRGLLLHRSDASGRGPKCARGCGRSEQCRASDDVPERGRDRGTRRVAQPDGRPHHSKQGISRARACREGLVKISFLIDRAGNLIASEIAESSNVPAFDAEALAMVKRGHPYPPPPKGVGGPHVALTVPVRFRQQVASGERRFYLNLQADLTLTLNGSSVQRAGLERAIDTTTNNDKNAQIIICSDEKVSPAELSSLVEQVKGTGFKFTVVSPADPTSD